MEKSRGRLWEAADRCVIYFWFISQKKKKRERYGNEGNKSPPVWAKYSLTGLQEEEGETKGCH